MPILFVFVDGVGVGARDPDVNPLAREGYLLSRFDDGSGEALPRGGRFTMADARLGVEGRPQSATGQTTILTGENAPGLLGGHLFGFPNGPLRELLQRSSLFRKLSELGGRGTFANSYAPNYLRQVGIPCDGESEIAMPSKLRASASTIAYSVGSEPFRTWADARAGRGVNHDITGEKLRAYGADVPARSPADAAEVLLELAQGHDLAMFEYFETDEAGHSRSMERAAAALSKIDLFLRRLVERMPEGWSLVVTSDHGNIEDLSSRNHTLAPVPVLAFGPGADRVEEIRDLTGVTPFLLSLTRVAVA